MSIILWIVLGGLAGWIASIVMDTNASQGLIMNIVIGIVGAFIGGFAFSMLGGTGVTGFNLYSMLVAVIGSVLLIGLVRMIKKA